MPTCSQAKIITNLESDIHKRFFRLAAKECDSNNNFLNGEAYLAAQATDSTECFYSIGNKVNHIEYIDLKNANQFCSDYCKSNSTLLLNNNNNINTTKSSSNQLPKQVNYYSQSYYNQFVNQSRKQKSFIEYVNNSRSAKTALAANRINSRRISVDEMPVSNNFEQQVSNKTPIIFGDFVAKRDTVPINFLYNSPFRNHRNNVTLNQAKINSLRSSLNIKTSSGGSDGEDGEEASSGISETNSSEKTSEKSSSSSPVNVIKLNPFNKINAPRKNVDHTHSKAKRNILEELRQIRQQVNEVNKTNQANTINIAQNSLDIKDASTRKLSGLLAQFPKLALENDSTENESNNSDNLNYINFDQLNSDANHYLKKLSLNQAKRLLALASIRPSKTFHKTMTEEEIEVLKKYYELIKPKVNSHNSNQLENDKYTEPYSPIVYDTSKVKFTSLQVLKQFLEKHKKDIDSNVYKVEYENNGFVLKNQLDENQSIKFPTEVNDTMFALTVTNSDKETAKLGEANLYRIINWNDTVVPATTNTKLSSNTLSSNATNSTQYIIKSAKTNNSKSIKLVEEITANKNFTNNLNERVSFDLNDNSSQQFSLPSLNKQEEFSFDYIKNLSGLVGSIVQPKLQKQLVYNGIDLSTLPGGSNFDIPTFEELGINLTNLLSDVPTNTNQVNNSNGTNGMAPTAPVEYQTSKLKNAAYKKLKEKISSNKCMTFNGPPERRPLDVIFEYAGVDIEHHTILDEVNKYLKNIGGYVKGLEFVPRSVHLGSVYVENQWILRLSDQNTKFFTITNGIQIKDEKISVKSYDEFIFGEYERYIRNEKYKQLIKNHEKAVQLSKTKSKK